MVHDELLFAREHFFLAAAVFLVPPVCIGSISPCRIIYGEGFSPTSEKRCSSTVFRIRSVLIPISN